MTIKQPNILFATGRPFYPALLGGAARSAHRLLVRLAELHGWRCRVICPRVPSLVLPVEGDHTCFGVRRIENKPGETTLHCGMPVSFVEDWATRYTEELETRTPDIVVTQMEHASKIARQARAANVAAVLLVRDDEFDAQDVASAAYAGTVLISNSKFIANLVERGTGSTSSYAYPIVERRFDVARMTPSSITMINTNILKGIETFLGVAAQMRACRFLLVESPKISPVRRSALHERLLHLPHVELYPHVSDPNVIYARTRLLLVPSIRREAFARVVVEAQQSGIPVLASDIGGLPESVGKGGYMIADHKNPVAWVRMIDRILDDSLEYERLSRLAQENADRLDFQEDVNVERIRQACLKAMQA